MLGMTVKFVSAVLVGCAMLVPVGATPVHAATASYADAVIRSSSIAYWQFADDPANALLVDSTGNQHLLDRHAAVIVSPGLQGVDGALSVGSQPTAFGEPTWATGGPLAALQGDHDRTVEFWFHTTSTVDGCLFSTGVPAHAESFSMCLTDGLQYASPSHVPGVYLQMYDGDTFVPAPQLTDGGWHYLAATLQGSSLVIDIDGMTPVGYIWGGRSYSAVSVQPFTLPFVPNTAASGVSVGGPGWQSGIAGVIDEVAVYGTALPTALLRAHVAAGAGSGTCGGGVAGAVCSVPPVALMNVVNADVQSLSAIPNITPTELQADAQTLQQLETAMSTVQQVQKEYQCILRNATSQVGSPSNCP